MKNKKRKKKRLYHSEFCDVMTEHPAHIPKLIVNICSLPCKRHLQTIQQRGSTLKIVRSVSHDINSHIHTHTHICAQSILAVVSERIKVKKKMREGENICREKEGQQAARNKETHTFGIHIVNQIQTDCRDLNMHKRFDVLRCLAR